MEQAENVLSDLCFTQYRVRHHDDVARLELSAEELMKALELRVEIESRIKACGYRYVAIDLGGFRSGSLNEGVIRVRNLA